MIIRLILAALTALFAVTGCSDKPKPESILTVNDFPVTRTQFNALNDTAAFNNLNAVERETRAREFATHWLAYAKAREAKLDESPEYLSRLASFENEFVVSRVFKEIVIPEAVTDSALKYIWTKRKTKRQVTEILVSHSLSMGPEGNRSPAAARVRVRQIYNRLKNNELTVPQAISIYSELPMFKMRNGNLGEVTYGSMPKPFCDAVWAAGVNDFLVIVEDKFGIHITFPGATLRGQKAKTFEEDRPELEKRIRNGDFGILEDGLNQFSKKILILNEAALDSERIHAVWLKVNKRYSPKHQTPVKFSTVALVFANDTVAVVKGRALTLAEIGRLTDQMIYLKDMEVSNGYTLMIAIRDVLNRYYIHQWALESGRIDLGNLENLKSRKSFEILNDLYIAAVFKKEPTLTRAAVYNRLGVGMTLTISPELLAK